MSKNEHLNEQLSAFLDGELSEAEATEVAARIANDPASRELFQELQETRRILQALPRESMPGGDLVEDVLSVAERGDLLNWDIPQARPHQARRFPFRAVASFVVLIGAGSTWMFWQIQEQSSLPRSVKRSVTESKLADRSTASDNSVVVGRYIDEMELRSGSRSRDQRRLRANRTRAAGEWNSSERQSGDEFEVGNTQVESAADADMIGSAEELDLATASPEAVIDEASIQQFAETDALVNQDSLVQGIAKSDSSIIFEYADSSDEKSDDPPAGLQAKKRASGERPASNTDVMVIGSIYAIFDEFEAPSHPADAPIIVGQELRRSDSGMLAKSAGVIGEMWSVYAFAAEPIQLELSFGDEQAVADFSALVSAYFETQSFANLDAVRGSRADLSGSFYLKGKQGANFNTAGQQFLIQGAPGELDKLISLYEFSQRSAGQVSDARLEIGDLLVRGTENSRTVALWLQDPRGQKLFLDGIQHENFEDSLSVLDGYTQAEDSGGSNRPDADGSPRARRRAAKYEAGKENSEDFEQVGIPLDQASEGAGAPKIGVDPDHEIGLRTSSRTSQLRRVTLSFVLKLHSSSSIAEPSPQVMEAEADLPESPNTSIMEESSGTPQD